LIERLLRLHPGCTEDEVARLATAESGRTIRVSQVRNEIDAAGGVVERDGRLWWPGTAPPAGESTPGSGADGRPAVRPERHLARRARVIAFDLETVLRQIVERPYLERHLYQIGAFRLSREAAWTGALPRSWVAWPRLHPNDEPLLAAPDVRAAYEAHKRDVTGVLDDFLSFCAGASHLVAYNGIGLDFPVIEALLAKHGRALPAGLEKVDGLYLAQALWPVPPNDHRLKSLLVRIGEDVGEFFWHDARDDARMLAKLLIAGQRKVGGARADGWSAERRRLARSVGAGSPAWDMLFDLLPERPVREEIDDAGVRAIVAAELAAGKAPIRDPAVIALGTPPPPGPLALPAALLDAGGRTDVYALANTARNGTALRRPSQDEMVSQMRGWIDAGTKALVEAPTGTGKSYAILAVALDWLAADPGRKVIVSTFTKALQAQLADDIERLAPHIPGLLPMTDLVKGSGNRLSLRGLLVALADLATATPRARIRGRPDFTGEARFRDLVLYLLLRLLEQGKPTEEWLAHSVDAADVPPMFEDYLVGPRGTRRRALYLAYLSQAQSGEVGERGGDLRLHTATIRQALAEHRLIIANHALLLAHLDEFEPEDAERTLLMVDEAHALEAAATQALSPAVATPDVEVLARDLAGWLRDVPAAARSSEHRALGAALDDLEDYLGYESLQEGARRAFDAGSGDGLGRSGPSARRVVVESPYAGALASLDSAAIKDAIGDLAGKVGRIGGIIADLPEPDDPFERERFAAIAVRAREMSKAFSAIGWDLYELDRPARRAAAPPTTKDRALDGAPVSGGAEADASGTGEGAGGGSGAESLPASSEAGVASERARPRHVRRDEGASNRVVWLEEIPSTAPLTSVRDLRFRVWSSPIDLGADPAYRDFRDRFRRTFYISATLRVGRDPEGAFDFMRARLALAPGAVGAIPLDSPFDMARQARLVAFDDFPSWTEQAEAAMRTVAHQLGGYAAELVRGNENGAMVLTTAKATAAGIGEYLMRSATAATLRLSAAEILGNRRAIGQFSAEGGILVGTKGLWQGVDISDPARMRLVWINKLPFPSFEDPIIKTRRALVAQRAEAANAEDPDAVANEAYYLPLAAIELRQAVGRLIRGVDHRGVVIVSDSKLAGPSRLRRQYRDIFLGSLDAGLLRPDPETGEAAGGNITSMAEGWREIWSFFAGEGLVATERAAELVTPDALRRQTLLPETRAILESRLTPAQEAEWRAKGGTAFADELVARCAAIGGHLGFRDGPIALKPEQDTAIRALAAGKDFLAVLPTGFGKSFVFQLPALALPGVTIVVSPLVSLMNDQALELNRSIGGAVRALIAPMRESNSRTGKAQVADALVNPASRQDIRLIYLSPERLCTRAFQDQIRAGVEAGIVRRIALDEAHTFVTWGDDFRPSFRRAERFLRSLKAAHRELQLLALTATATTTVRNGLRRSIFGLPELDRAGKPPVPDPDTFAFISADPLRSNLALWTRRLGALDGGPIGEANTALSVVAKLDRHAIIYCLTVKQAVGLHNLLVTALGPAARDGIKLYHGRLPDGQKAAVLSAFRAAPHYDPDDPEAFSRLIVVATSAFGLGIDRDDIRTVFCAAPPTDLAALYQQVGRAGRDTAPATGLMLASRRAFGLLRFMTRRDLNRTRLARITGMLLAPEPQVNTLEVARDLVAEELTAGTARVREAAHGLEDQIHVQVVRVLAELAAVGCLDDLGDFPANVKIVKGTVSADTSGYRDLLAAIWAAVDDPADVRLPVLYERLAPAFGAEIPDVGALWSLLLALHGEGFIEVSQWGNRATLTGLRHHPEVVLPDDFVSRFEARSAAVDEEVNRLIDFFDRPACVNARFAEYFGDGAHEHICDLPATRCSWHWNTLAGSADDEGKLYAAFYAPKREFAGRSDFRSRELRDLPNSIEGLLRYQGRGLAFNLLHAILRGREGFFRTGDRTWRPLWPALVENRFFRRFPTLKSGELEGALALLEDGGRIVRVGAFYRHVEAIAMAEADDARRARRAADASARTAARAARAIQ
jgi:superfamily II DNA helicase RecQ/Rad3-related DNA helicase